MCAVVANASRHPWWLPIALVILTLLAGCAPTDATRRPDDPASVTPPAQPPRIVASEQVKGRIWDLTIDSPAVGREVKVRLLVPARFQTAESQRWPVLYLLHGCCDTYEAWTRSTDIEKTDAKS